MPRLDAVADFRLVLEDNRLIALFFPLRGGNYLGARNRWRAQRYLIAIGDAQYFIQLNTAAFGRAQSLNLYGLARRHLVLLASGLNYRVNGPPP